MHVTRRRFVESGLLAGAGIWMAGAGPDGAAAPAGTPPRVDGARLRRDLEGLSVFGRPEGGTFADGVSRVGYGDADIAGRRFVMGLMRSAGLEPRVDAAGNISAIRRGQRPSAPPILCGSHIDSVPSGGNFDGTLGSLSAIEAVRSLDAAGLVTQHPLEVVVWSQEEGVAFLNGLSGSRAAAGRLVDGEMTRVWNGMTKSEAVRRIGGDPDRLGDARRASGSFHAYLELHVEQGGTLDRLGVPIGVVEGIVGIARFEVTVTGVANHAGTTPMADRQDALVAASHVVLAVREVVTGEPGRQVGTVGQLNVTPNAPNVVPGQVTLLVELRDLADATLTRLAEAIGGRCAQIAASTGTRIDIRETGRYAGAPATPAVQDAIERAAALLGLKAMRLPSGAGHDAQMMATLGPMGMIFVPSVGGVSHSPKEFTRWEHCTAGADTLLRAILEVDASTF